VKLPLIIGVFGLFLLAVPESDAVVSSPDMAMGVAMAEAHEGRSTQEAEAEITLRRLKSGHFADEDGLDFLEQVRKIRLKIGKQ
tara:strand:+ start:259 stop:510 length:252 start_codon:yes stop_codon:yes gene_type:complete